MNNYVTIAFVRHGESEGNVAGTKMAELEKSNYDFALTELGHKQAEAAANFLSKKFGFPQRTFASTFLRSLETAKHFMQIGDFDPFIDPRLDERWDGVFHGLPTETVATLFPHELQLRKKYGWYHHRATGGENGPDIEMKIRGFIRDAYENYRGRTIFVAGHGNWMLILERFCKNLTIDEINQMKRVAEVPNGCISVYRFFSPINGAPVIERHFPDPSLKSVKSNFA